MSLPVEREEGGPVSKTSLSGEREEGGPVSKTSLPGEHDSQTKAKRVQQERPDSPVPSCVSMKSDWSMEPTHTFSKGVLTTEPGEHQERPGVPSGQSVQGHQTDLASIFTLLQEDVITFMMKELKRFQKILRPDYPECLESQMEEEEQRSSAREGALKITLHFLRNMKQQELADTLENSKRLCLQSVILYCIVHEESLPIPGNLALVCQRKLRTNLKNKCECVSEVIGKEGNSALLNQIYTDLHMTEGGSGEVNTQHEVRQIETRKPLRSETPIRVNDIFKGPPGQFKPIRTVLTKGVAGIGKTFATQKFTLDWADGKANQHVQFTFPIPFRELNLLKQEEYTLLELLHKFFNETKEARITDFNKYQVVFVFDGLDECRLPLDFQNNEIWTDVTEPTSVDVLLTNLIKGNLLPSALLWITTRPAAANQIPSEYVDMVTEVRGFNDPQKEEFIMKRYPDEKNLASRITSHIKTSRSLHIMCHIPVFCLITATVLEHMLTTDQRGELPKTLTEMYIQFLVFQSIQGNVKYHRKAEADSHWNTENRKIIMSLGKLAFQQLEKGNLIFYESDLTESCIEVKQASVCSGVFTQIFREERGLYQSQNKVFCFVHLSIQEFLAAVYVILSFFNDKQNVIYETPSPSNQFLHSVHRVAVDRALQSENGHWDLFLRFLLGLSLETNQRLLRGLLTQTQNTSETNDETVEYIKKVMEKEDVSPERSINLIHCLNELGDKSVINEVQGFLTRGGFQLEDLSASQITALVFVLVTSEEELEVFDLKKYSRSEEGLLKLLPVLEAKTPRSLLLSNCAITEKGCASLASVLSSNPSHLRELDLSYNHPGDSGVELLSALLQDPHCTLETLRLSSDAITEEGFASLASALRSNPSHLRELDLSYNHPGDFGIKQLSHLLKDPHCGLETLRLSGCVVTDTGFKHLASALSSNPSHLRELDLSYNHTGDSGVKLLSALLEDPQCRLKILRLSGCTVTEEGCASVASALGSNPSHLRELDLSYNHPGDSGVKLLSDLLEDPHCGMDTLKMSECSLSARCCEDIGSALNSSALRVLDLSNNDLQDSGVNLLSVGLGDPLCNLETLRLSGCLVTEEGCGFLASALSSNPAHLRELDLSNNDLQDFGLKLLSLELGRINNNMESLRLSGCMITEKGFASLASALSSNPSHLRELDLSYNHPGDSGGKLLSALLKDPHCRMDTLKLDHGGEIRIKAGLQKYACDLTLDPNTANRKLSLSEENRKVTWRKEEQPYPDHPERFDSWTEVLCREGLTGSRWYWEVERRGTVSVGVTYRGISRRGRGGDCLLGYNNKSWVLVCYDNRYSARHNEKITVPPLGPAGSTRVGVYLDCPAGTLSFYRVSSDTLTLLHTFHSTFTQPLYPAFGVWDEGSSALL
ncbi:NACHT, LRR and PYD domains-containing protein 3-like [Aplochiton taeniatus]